MSDSRSSSRATSAGSWSRPSTSVRTSAATSSSSPSSPASRVGQRPRSEDRTGQLAGLRRAAAPIRLARRAPLPPIRRRRAPRGSRRRPGRSPRRAAPAPSRATDVVGLADPQPGRRDLAGLVLGELDPTDELARVDASSASAARFDSPALDRAGHRLARDPAAAVGVEQVALGPLVEEPLLVVLAVDLDESADRLGQPRGGDRLVVEAGRGAAAGARPRGRR